MTGPGRPPTIIPSVVERVKQAHGAQVHIKDLAFALELTTSQVTTALGRYVRRHDAEVIRVKNGVYRWVSPAEQARRKGRAAKVAKKAQARLPELTGRLTSSASVAASKIDWGVEDNVVTSKGGWVAPADTVDIPAMSVKRGGLKFPPRLEVGLTMEDATVAHVATVDTSDDVYFVWRGKMWKAFSI